MAWNIRRLRVQNELSQEALAADAQVDRSYVGRLERGVENPTIGILEKLATVLGAEVGELFVSPGKNERAPQTLRGGRRKTRQSKVRERN